MLTPLLNIKLLKINFIFLKIYPSCQSSFPWRQLITHTEAVAPARPAGGWANVRHTWGRHVGHQPEGCSGAPGYPVSSKVLEIHIHSSDCRETCIKSLQRRSRVRSTVSAAQIMRKVSAAAFRPTINATSSAGRFDFSCLIWRRAPAWRFRTNVRLVA